MITTVEVWKPLQPTLLQARTRLEDLGAGGLAGDGEATVEAGVASSNRPAEENGLREAA